MRLLSARLVAALIVGVALVSLFSAYYEVVSERRRQSRDLERRAELLGDSLAANVEPYFERGSVRELQKFVQRFGNREHLAGVAVYDRSGALLAASGGVSQHLKVASSVVEKTERLDAGIGEFLQIDSQSKHVYALPLHRRGEVAGALAIVHDAGYIEALSRRVRREAFFRVLVETGIIVLITL